MSIARFAVTRRVAVAMIATAIVVLGLFAIPRLAIALLPSFSPPVVSVTVNYPNVSPETMETEVTRPIENAVSRVPGIDILQSDSYQGQTVVRAQFHFGTNIDTAAVDIQEQIARIRNQLPNDPTLQEPQILKADPNALPVVYFYVTDKRMPLRDLSDLIDNQLADEFSAVPGVASVSTSGEAQRAIVIEPDEHTLAGYGLTPNSLVTRISAENLDLPAGIVQIGRNEYQIRTNALYTGAQEVADTVVAVKNGAPIYVRDVAKVSDSIEEQRIFTRANGVPAVRIFITAQPDANIVATANGVYKKVEEIKRRYPGIGFFVGLEQRGFILESISALEHTALYGAALAVLIIMLFLHSWRSTLIVAVSLPISILGTLFAAYATGQTLNTMTLGGLALAVGLIVDDAIVVIENIYRHMSQGESPVEAAERATTQILTAVIASSVTVITVFIPLMLIPGLQGLIFQPFALMVMVAVGLSLVVAVTTVPMLSSRILRADPPQHGAALGNGRARPAGGVGEARGGAYARFCAAFDAAYERLAERYRRFLRWSLDHPAAVLGTGALVFAGTLVALRFGIVATEIFPQTNTRFARFDIKAPTGTALDVTNRLTAMVEARIKTDPLVDDVDALVGSLFAGGGNRQISNDASLAVTLKEGVSSEEAGAFVRRWQQRLGGTVRRTASRLQAREAAPKLSPRDRAQIAALRRALTGVVIRGRTLDIIQQQITQGQDALQVQIFGRNISTLNRLAQGAINQLALIPGIPRPDTNLSDVQPELDVHIDRRKAAEHGFSTGQVAQAIDTATSGTISTYYQVNGIEYPMIVELPPSQRRSFGSLSNLMLSPPTTVGTAGGSASISGTGVVSGATGSSVSVTTSANPLAPSSLSPASIPLSAVASISVGVGPSQISRQNKERRIDINAPVIGRPLGDVISDAKRIMDRIELPSGYRWQFGPAIQQNAETFASLGLIVALAILLIYMLLAAQFESYLHPLVIMMSVPLASAGIVASLVVSHRAFGLTAFIGTLMLVGIVVKNAILVVEFTNQLRHEGQSARDALLHAAPMRLRPILMTTVATIGGMLPLALGIEAGSSTQAPLGTVVVGGLITSTLLSLVVVPTLYLWVAEHVEPRFTAKPPRPLSPRRPVVVPPEPART